MSRIPTSGTGLSQKSATEPVFSLECSPMFSLPVRAYVGVALLITAVCGAGCAEVAPYHSHRMLSLAHQAERDEGEASRAAEQVRADQLEIEQTLESVRADAAQARSSAGHRTASTPKAQPKSKSPVIRKPVHPVSRQSTKESAQEAGAQPALPPAAEHQSK
ncbi:MAG: hypothetical protein U0136_09690 [Bdellovibrionota bacterium]